MNLLRHILPFCCCVLLASVMHYIVAPLGGPYMTKLLMDIGINMMLAVSLGIVNGLTGQFSIGHAGFMAIGGYTAGIVSYYGSLWLWSSAAALPGLLSPGSALFVVACVIGGVCAGICGLAVGLPSLRLRGDYLAIVTLGFGEIIRVLLQQTDDVLFTRAQLLDTPLWKIPTHVGGALGFGGLPFYTNLFWITLGVCFTAIIAWRLKSSSFGRACLAIREDELAAESMGVPTTRLKVTAFVLAGFFAGVAGALFAHEIGNVLSPRELGFQKSFDIIIMVVMGGMGSISGALLTATLLTALTEWLRVFAEYRLIVYAAALIGMMLLRPQGLLGIRELWQLSWRRRGADA